MTSTGRRITVLAALLAVAVAAAAVYLYTARSTGVSMASAAGTPAMTAEQIQPFLLTQAEHPEGTEYQEAPISAANQAVNQGGMVVTPQSCLGALQIALGDAQATGWMQAGSRPTKSGRTPFQSAVGIVKGGLDLAKLREAVGTCSSGTISWPEKKLTASISLSEVPAPAVKGMSTFAYKSTMKFTNVTQAEIEPIESCPIEPGPELGSFETVAKECVEHAPVSQERMDITTEQYVAYAAVENVYVEACAASPAEIEQLLAVPSDRLRAAGHI
ncbi:hypothetical protein [Phytohabitans houttuyneae]|jgi:hypothetical protein|uniref:Uncharacterized protein n=1 Tax=Phytohabitans houttuyneae TaxID=1076126 RepID=A0A6V8K4Y9_9ACTN|nr:hypothetical protein [Phytohabitans houttuyneae]GFJ76827.1 hypothetical protein Phou_010070 [Phytohabitans houttuyneae]